MDPKPVVAAIGVLATCAAAVEAEEVLLWGPSDFEAVWVSIKDRAENGCWTNIGETTEYAADQLKLADFNVVEKPDLKSGRYGPIIEDNYATFVVGVEASRLRDGLCVGNVRTYFLGSVVPRKRQTIYVVNPVGWSRAWTVWDDKNLNNYVLDHIKGFIPYWVRSGKYEPKEN